MIWATLSYQSCFCWLFGASSSSDAKNIINLISVLTIWWCPCVESSLTLLEEGIAMTSMFSWQNSVRLYPASFCTPRPNLCVTPGVSWLPTFAFQVPIMKMTSFWVLVLEGLVGLHKTVQVFWHQRLGHRLGLLQCWMIYHGNEPRSFFNFWDCTQVLHFWILL